ncbi:MAG: ABC transporter ATP-binding protein [Deltaproteobacteria bacterium]|nr:ABC transporter ATP-binding protein [Deltaproteobacteria bacterium]
MVDDITTRENGSIDRDEPDSNSLVLARGLNKSYISSGSKIEILRDADLTLRSGETVAIVGASGIGKSTLLQILGTLDQPDSGNLWFLGKNIFKLDPIQLASFRNSSIGFVFQFHHLLPEFTALENAMMPGLIKGLSKPLSKNLAEKILVRVGLKSRLQQQVTKLSGGEQQRVALARALVLKPALLLADEPTGNLDQKNSEQVHELLTELNQELNMTMVVVTHNMKLASYMDRRVTILDGKLVEAN